MTNNQREIITIRCEERNKKDGKGTFQAFKFNKDGKAVDLSFRQDSNSLKDLPKNAIVKVVVERLQPDARSFYPKYWATFIELAPKSDAQMSQENVETN